MGDGVDELGQGFCVIEEEENIDGLRYRERKYTLGIQ
jgi:hypothetical protein